MNYVDLWGLCASDSEAAAALMSDETFRRRRGLGFDSDQTVVTYDESGKYSVQQGGVNLPNAYHERAFEAVANRDYQHLETISQEAGNTYAAVVNNSARVIAMLEGRNPTIIDPNPARQLLKDPVSLISAMPMIMAPREAGSGIGLRQKYKNLVAKARSKFGGNGKRVIQVTPKGIALPPGKTIPKNLEQSPYRSGSYGKIDPSTGKYTETLRIDSPTAAGNKGPNYSHFHINGGKSHLTDMSKWPGGN